MCEFQVLKYYAKKHTNIYFAREIKLGRTVRVY